tara:strand:- start:813 stop:1436 length:624 start_codon:yes stop_codon:yes gene_type:complete
MNIKKSKIALALGTLIFLAAPLSSAFADQKSCEMGGTMASMKSELRGYVKGFKGDDAQKMQQHMNALLQLSEKTIQKTPENMNAKAGAKMDHSKMDMKDMPEMDHSKMDMKEMAAMDHSKMDMKETAAMDHSKMDMKEMAAMDHSKMDMEGMSNEQHQHMMYMQNMTGLNDMFKQLSKTQDKSEIKVILGKIKDHSNKHQMFKKDCK